MRKRVESIIFLCLMLVVLGALTLGGCGKGNDPAAEGYRIYYLDVEETELIEEYCETEEGMKEESVESQIEEVLKLLKKEPDTIDYKSVFIGGVKIQDWELRGTKLLLNFNGKYYELDKASELLLRAAVVQSLVQISGVDYVGILVDGEHLLDNNEREMGYLRAEDFVQNTGSSLHSYQTASLTLYFSNSKGDALAEEEVNVRYNSNMSIEKLIVERIMKGPSSEENKSVIPAEAKVLSVSVKDNVCYVNFDEGFLNMVEKVNPKITIYSLVNSIIDNSGSAQVQILVNGENNIAYQETIDLSKPFVKDSSLIEEKEEKEE